MLPVMISGPVTPFPADTWPRESITFTAADWAAEANDGYTSGSKSSPASAGQSMLGTGSDLWSGCVPINSRRCNSACQRYGMDRLTRTPRHAQAHQAHEYPAQDPGRLSVSKQQDDHEDQEPQGDYRGTAPLQPSSPLCNSFTLCRGPGPRRSFSGQARTRIVNRKTKAVMINPVS